MPLTFAIAIGCALEKQVQTRYQQGNCQLDAGLEAVFGVMRSCKSQK